MISENMYNRIFQIFLNENVRLENNLVECQNYILRFRPSDPEPYIKLIQAQAQIDYFNQYVFTLLYWFNKFVESG